MNIDEATKNDELDNRSHYSLTNRERSRTAKRTKFWCQSCDMQLVSLTKKCPICGSRQNRKKLR